MVIRIGPESNKQLFIQLLDGYSICDQIPINSCSFSCRWLFDLRQESNKQLFVPLSDGYSYYDQNQITAVHSAVR